MKITWYYFNTVTSGGYFYIKELRYKVNTCICYFAVYLYIFDISFSVKVYEEVVNFKPQWCPFTWLFNHLHGSLLYDASSVHVQPFLGKNEKRNLSLDSMWILNSWSIWDAILGLDIFFLNFYGYLT